jgi:hypothetical protein
MNPSLWTICRGAGRRFGKPRPFPSPILAAAGSSCSIAFGVTGRQKYLGHVNRVRGVVGCPMFAKLTRVFSPSFCWRIAHNHQIHAALELLPWNMATSLQPLS